MEMPKSMIVERIRSRSGHEMADRADEELPEGAPGEGGARGRRRAPLPVRAQLGGIPGPISGRWLDVFGEINAVSQNAATPNGREWRKG